MITIDQSIDTFGTHRLSHHSVKQRDGEWCVDSEIATRNGASYIRLKGTEVETSTFQVVHVLALMDCL